MPRISQTSDEGATIIPFPMPPQREYQHLADPGTDTRDAVCAECRHRSLSIQVEGVRLCLVCIDLLMAEQRQQFLNGLRFTASKGPVEWSGMVFD